MRLGPVGREPAPEEVAHLVQKQPCEDEGRREAQPMSEWNFVAPGLALEPAVLAVPGYMRLRLAEPEPAPEKDQQPVGKRLCEERRLVQRVLGREFVELELGLEPIGLAAPEYMRPEFESAPEAQRQVRRASGGDFVALELVGYQKRAYEEERQAQQMFGRGFVVPEPVSSSW
ncbi:hypothetical protein FS749_014152 [Ceratobasidium sp. UAMH 11750]|nr:hypothetical protein FS749_014152 [Ceratobasidium sp. UAMH 11750]